MKKALFGTSLFFTSLLVVSCKETVNSKTDNSSTITGAFNSKSLPVVSATVQCNPVVTSNYQGSSQQFQSIQAAIDAAKEGAIINVGSGTWKEFIQIKDKQGLTIISKCSAIVYQVKIKESKNIVIEGFDITASLDTEKGISVESSVSVAIKSNKIFNLKEDAKGIWIGPKSFDILLSKNYIHHNKGDGIVFSNSEKGGNHLLKDNVIYANSKVGIVLSKKQSIKLEHNTIMSNGDYGIKKDGNDDSGPEMITLINNVVTFNHGKIKTVGSSNDKHDNSKGKHSSLLNLFLSQAYAAETYVSSSDLGSFSSYMDTTDSGNVTTMGVEGSGTTVNNDTTAPIITFSSQDNIATPQSLYFLSVRLEDSSPVNVDVYHNGVKIFNTQNFFFDLAVTLQEGINVFQVQAVDSSQNVGSVRLNSIILDTTPPALTAVSPEQSGLIFTNHLPLSLNVLIASNEPLSGGTADTKAVTLSEDQLSSSAQMSFTQAGPLQINATLFDIVGNVSNITINSTVVLDNTAPALSFGISDGVITNQPNFSIPVVVTDESPTITKVIVNDIEVFQTSATQFDAAIALINEGINTIKLQSTDAAGNVSSFVETTVIRDMMAPVLSHINLANASTLESLVVPIRGDSPEKLASLTVNGQVMTLSADGLAFSGSIIFEKEGNQQLDIVATDIAGNSSTLTMTIQINTIPDLHSGWKYEECPLQL